MIISRRGILRSLLAAPAIIAVDRLMPVKWFDPRRTIALDFSVGNTAFVELTSDVDFLSPGGVYDILLFVIDGKKVFSL